MDRLDAARLHALEASLPAAAFDAWLEQWSVRHLAVPAPRDALPRVVGRALASGPRRPLPRRTDVLVVVTSDWPGLRVLEPVVAALEQAGLEVTVAGHRDVTGRLGGVAAERVVDVQAFLGTLPRAERVRALVEGWRAHRVARRRVGGDALGPPARSVRVALYGLAARRLLAALRPRAVVGISYFSGFERQLARAARRGQVPVVSVQQGLREHPEHQLAPVAADHFLAWGPATRAWFPHEAGAVLHEVGSPWLDARRTAWTPREPPEVLLVDAVKTVRGRHGPDAVGPYLDHLAHALAPLPPEVRIRVKLRPGHGEAPYRERWPSALLQRTEWVDGSGPFLEAARTASVVVSGHSSATLEAVASGIPVVLDGRLVPEGEDGPYQEAGIPVAPDARALTRAVEEILGRRDPAPVRVSHLLHAPGSAAQNVVACLRRIMDAAQPPA